MAEGVRSSLTCPLIANGKPVGFLFFSSHQLNAYQDAHVDRFMRIARQLSFIVDKGRCYEEVSGTRLRLANLLNELLPKGIPEQLARGDGRAATAFDEATVLFADIVGFSSWSRRMKPAAVVEFLNGIFTEFDHLARKCSVQKISTHGDSYLAVAGVPTPTESHAESAATLALAMRTAVRSFTLPGGGQLSLRIGIHTGPLLAGIIGEHVYHYDVWGQTVNFASRLESSSDSGRIQISAQTCSRLRHRFQCRERGVVDIKDFGPHKTYWL
jgi:class 3 adenylate cyclase